MCERQAVKLIGSSRAPRSSLGGSSVFPRVRVLTDIPVDEFDALIAGASIVVAVLLQDRVAGVTLIRAAQVAGAMVIACGSPYLSEYVESGVDGVLARDIDDTVQWVLRAWRAETSATRLRQGGAGACRSRPPEVVRGERQASRLSRAARRIPWFSRIADSVTSGAA